MPQVAHISLAPFTVRVILPVEAHLPAALGRKKTYPQPCLRCVYIATLSWSAPVRRIAIQVKFQRHGRRQAGPLALGGDRQAVGPQRRHGPTSSRLFLVGRRDGGASLPRSARQALTKSIAFSREFHALTSLANRPLPRAVRMPSALPKTLRRDPNIRRAGALHLPQRGVKRGPQSLITMIVIAKQPAEAPLKPRGLRPLHPLRRPDPRAGSPGDAPRMPLPMPEELPPPAVAPDSPRLGRRCVPPPATITTALAEPV